MFLRRVDILKRLVSRDSSDSQVSPFGGGVRGRIFSKPEVITEVSRTPIVLPLDPPPKGEENSTQVSPFGGGLGGRIFSNPEVITEVSRTPIVLPLDPPPKGEGRKIPASSIAEVVIALTIIALCFTVASLIFIRSINVSTRFQDIRKQTEIQSKIMESLYRDNDSIPLIEMEDITVKTVQDEANEKLNVIEFLGTDNRVIWKQQVLKTSGN